MIASARSPSPRPARLIARRPAASPAPASAAAAANRSDRSRSSNVMAHRAALRNSSRSGAKSDSRVSNARRTVACMSSSSSLASRWASWPRIRDRYSSPAVARRSSPKSGCARRAMSLEPLRSTVTRFIRSATSRSWRCTRSHSKSTPSGSHCDNVSTTKATSGASPLSWRPTIPLRLSDTATRSSHIHTPATCRIRPAEI